MINVVNTVVDSSEPCRSKYVSWLVSWSLTSLFSTNMAVSETKGQGWRVIFLPSEGRLAMY